MTQVAFESLGSLFISWGCVFCHQPFWRSQVPFASASVWVTGEGTFAPLHGVRGLTPWKECHYRVFCGSFFSDAVPESGRGSALGGNVKWRYISYPGTCLFLHQILGVATPEQMRRHTQPPPNGSCGLIALGKSQELKGPLNLLPTSLIQLLFLQTRSDKWDRHRPHCQADQGLVPAWQSLALSLPRTSVWSLRKEGSEPVWGEETSQTPFSLVKSPSVRVLPKPYVVRNPANEISSGSQTKRRLSQLPQSPQRRRCQPEWGSIYKDSRVCM